MRYVIEALIRGEWSAVDYTATEFQAVSIAAGWANEGYETRYRFIPGTIPAAEWRGCEAAN
jgi:hypothetical protein